MLQGQKYDIELPLTKLQGAIFLVILYVAHTSRLSVRSHMSIFFPRSELEAYTAVTGLAHSSVLTTIIYNAFCGRVDLGIL